MSKADRLKYPPMFRGLGSERISVTLHYPRTVPCTVTAGQARRMIDHFIEHGNSSHSAEGATMWVLLEHCQWARLRYRLDVVPGAGYYVSLS